MIVVSSVILHLVPILSRPEGPELLLVQIEYNRRRRSNPLQARRPGATCWWRCSQRYWQAVPILSRPEGPELRLYHYWHHQTSPSSNPLQARRPGATPTKRQLIQLWRSSNPLQARRPGATSPSNRCSLRTKVPILSRPEGPELHRRAATMILKSRFQSSPGPKARSYNTNSPVRTNNFMFQSSPGPKARSYEYYQIHIDRQVGVPILSRPEGPELRRLVAVLLGTIIVPILSRPEGPELQYCRGFSSFLLMFQSSPGPKARSYPDILRPNKTIRRSNPLQARRPGATARWGFDFERDPVPILSRPEGPELRRLPSQR